MDDLITKYEAKVAENPANELFRFSLGKALLDAGRAGEAKIHLEAALAKRPDWMVVVMLLAQVALREQNPAAAKARYEQALQLALAQKHEDPEKEIRTALAELDRVN
jgi:uncharacterized protein HemY